MIIKGISLCFVNVLATLTLFVITDASISSDLIFGKEDIKKLNVFNVEPVGKTLKFKRYKSTDSKDVQDNSEDKTRRLNSLRLEWNPRNRRRRSIDTTDRTVNENEQNGYGSKFYENTTPSNQKSSRATGARKNDDQDLRKYLAKRVDYSVNKEKSVDNENQTNTKDDYYAQRKHIMERFDIRQREIADKYRNENITIPNNVLRNNSHKQIKNKNMTSIAEIERKNIYKRISTVNNSYNELATYGHNYSNMKTDKHSRKTRMENDRVSSIVNDTDENYEYEYYEDNEDEISGNIINPADTTARPVDTTTVPSYDMKTTVVIDKITTEWGNCANGVGKLLYQHNLVLKTHRGTLTVANVMTSLEGSVCITCIRVIRLNKTNATISMEVTRGTNGTLQKAELKVNGLENEELQFTVRIWTVRKYNNHCEGVEQP